MRFIQFGAGRLSLPHPWENYDLDVDCAKPLPRDRFPDGCAAIVFSEMMLEHITPQQAWSFLEECHRILVPTGLVRIVIPDFSLSWRLQDPDWLRVNQGVTNNNGSLRDQFKSIIFAHGHQGLWNSELLRDVMSAIGFKRATCKRAGESDFQELRDIEQHWHSVGKAVALSESGCVEAVR